MRIDNAHRVRDLAQEVVRLIDAATARARRDREESNARADAEFIVDARTALPKALDALEAVLALHCAEPYAQGPDYCTECEHRSPCPTVAAITEALGVEP